MDGDRAQDQRSQLLKLRHDYGNASNVLVPAEQPDPHDCDRELPRPDERGTLDPQALKHWRYFVRTEDFRGQRYMDLGILVGTPFILEGIVPKFQKALDRYLPV